MIRIPSLHALAGAAVLALAPAAQALPAHYHVTDLGLNVYGEDINSNGEIAVFDTRTGKAKNKAAYWQNGVVVDLPEPGPTSAAYAINDAGVIGGLVALKNAAPQAAIWTASHSLVELGGLFPGALSSQVTAVSPNGDCGMTVDVPNVGTRAFYAPGCGNPVELPTLGGSGGANGIVGINASGQAAGYATTAAGPSNTLAFIWQNGVMKNLGVCRNKTNSAASGINAAGHAVGSCSDDFGAKLAAFYYDGSSMITMGSLGGKQTVADDINDAEVIVGRSQDAAGNWRAFVDDRSGAQHPLVDLQTLLDSSGAGWILSGARKINASGQILVDGTFNGVKGHTALLTPVN